ncbi:hypothetical protein [Metabacillus niabensis]|uniref:Uncharacterized protein n=1 Tax=Metabacillus niabensis TaxID=324854 RepID=A0ABT9Z023_9BACI|nr:hypothetical protein [Metabacillus niabensis]MDQ0225202.1 hypothetical protein [Metabacillus niabensis]PAD68087.1 hypothetical protein CHH83_15425 [Bacillus sp. 7586-K]
MVLQTNYHDIGQPWFGKHVIILNCSIHNKFIQIYKSYHAPIEPPRPNCAETISQLISIGYKLQAVTALPFNQVQYVFIL